VGHLVRWGLYSEGSKKRRDFNHKKHEKLVGKEEDWKKELEEL
jgi:hypothetical protein